MPTHLFQARRIVRALTRAGRAEEAVALLAELDAAWHEGVAEAIAALAAAEKVGPQRKVCIRRQRG
jgi:hypothetical protein